MSYTRFLVPLALMSGAYAASSKSCPRDLPLSCHNTTAVADTCCFIPAGQLLQTQFWDANPAAGPSDSWTIHGLWPDYCDGTYPQFCDTSREYDDIRGIVSQFLGNSTLSYINKYWVSDNGDDESLWKHEWDKHGTCISTLEPDCYTGYKTGAEAADYVKRTVSLFKTLPTYKWLSEAGIEPSDSKTYTASEIQDALEEQHGAQVTLGCSGKNLNEVWYHFNVQGSLQEGTFVPSDPDGSKSSCPDSGIKYLPKTS
ncbi:Ribonuclease Trv [Fusarium ambrosium]|uniref:ribonuclease T2 n=1 Tax=Fusarium ambrosium TaxID=131363 RepID=A0A428SZK2_9HYPO|nr:Ribonuclease Trv [Fusarium ambrosium]